MKDITKKTNKNALTPPNRCYMSHKPLTMGRGYQLHGGSALDPHMLNMDIYVFLDRGYTSNKVPNWYPWSKFTVISYQIPNMQTPPDKVNLDKLIEYLSDALVEGKSVYVGCIGGHGRTGMILSLLVNNLLFLDDSTTYVRQHYCPKAVESASQIEYLRKHYGITPVAPVKQTYSTKSPSWTTSSKSNLKYMFDN